MKLKNTLIFYELKGLKLVAVISKPLGGDKKRVNWFNDSLICNIRSYISLWI